MMLRVLSSTQLFLFSMQRHAAPDRAGVAVVAVIAAAGDRVLVRRRRDSGGALP